MLLQDLPSRWIVPAASQPELIAIMVRRVDENVAPRNLSFGQPGEAEINKLRTDAAATIGFCNSEVIKESGATVVAAKYSTDDFILRCNGDSAKARISPQE